MARALFPTASSQVFLSSRRVRLSYFFPSYAYSCYADFYVQLMAYGDFTKLNIIDGDYGGEPADVYWVELAPDMFFR